MKKLLVALDGSDRARGVLAAAGALAGRLDARLILVRATSIAGELPVEAYASDPEEVERVLAERAMADLEALAGGVLKPGLVASIRAQPGPAWRVIEDVARAEDADMIVIGAHGYGTFERMLGTVAAKVVDHADRPVFVVRAAERLTS